MWIPAGTKQHGQIKWFFPDINASPLSSAREVSVRCVQFRSAWWRDSAAFSQTINHYKRSIATIDTCFIDRFILLMAGQSRKRNRRCMRCLRHVFSWLTQCNQAFPLTDCSEENPVPYSAGNRDHRVTDGTQNRTGNRGKIGRASCRERV